MTALESIRQLDYTVIFARDLPRMRRFYEDVMRFPIHQELGASWVGRSRFLAQPDPELVYYHGSHASEKGYARIAELMLAAIEKDLAR